MNSLLYRVFAYIAKAKEMRREKMDRFTSQVNLPANTIQEASTGNREIGCDQLPTPEEIDSITRPLSSAELIEAVKRLATVMAEPLAGENPAEA